MKSTDLAIKIDRICNIIATSIGYLSTLVPLFFGYFFFGYITSKVIFIYVLCEALFACWLVSAIVNKKYRKKVGLISIAVGLYVIILILASVFGIDPQMSFWSNFSRGTGVIFIIHLFLFFFAASRLFDKKIWHKIMGILAIIGGLISLVLVCGYMGITDKDIAINYATMGNSSFLATYLVFSLFFGIYLGFNKESYISFLIFEKRDIAFLMKLSALFSLIGLILSTGRAAAASSILGLLTLLCLYLAFNGKSKRIKIVGRVFSVLAITGIILGATMLNIPDSFVQKQFAKFATNTRSVVWKTSMDLVKERPVLGYGPENFETIFSTKASPELFFASHEQELRFDRAHNIIWDTLTSSGILGFVSYISIFFIAILFLWKERKRFWLFATFFCLMLAYFLQNLTVFDTPVGYFTFFFFLSYLSSLQLKEKKDEYSINWYKISAIFFVIITFLICFNFFVVRQYKMVRLSTIVATSGFDFQERTKVLASMERLSPWGGQQIREYYAMNVYDEFKEGRNSEREVKIALGALLKNRQERPNNFYNLINIAKLGLALKDFNLVEDVLNQAKNINDKNIFYLSYATELKIAQKEYNNALLVAQRAITLEPRIKFFYNLALRVSKLLKDEDLIQNYERLIAKKFTDPAY